MSADPVGGELLTNLLHFGRLLRGLGLKVSSTQISELAQSLRHFDFTQRRYFYYAARAYLVTSPEQIALFDQAFDLFWAGRQTWMLQFGMTRQVRETTHVPLDEGTVKAAGSREIAAADDEIAPENDDSELQVDATYSAIEVLRQKDFEAFSEEELELAKAFIRSLRWHIQERLTRRYQHASKHARQIDLPRTIRGSMHYGGEIMRLDWKRRKTRPRPLVVICDISGSMDRYSRLFLHFIHTMRAVIDHIEAFVFGTRLTRITPVLRYRDVDAAVDQVSGMVVDWSGGTRIGESLRTFNYRWSRRVLGRGAVVIIISDGWDRGDIALLRHEIARLSRSVSRLIWLNPLAGAPDYQPLVKGIEAVMPHCDDFMPLHNLASLEELAQTLGRLDRDTIL